MGRRLPKSRASVRLDLRSSTISPAKDDGGSTACSPASITSSPAASAASSASLAMARKAGPSSSHSARYNSYGRPSSPGATPEGSKENMRTTSSLVMRPSPGPRVAAASSADSLASKASSKRCCAAASCGAGRNSPTSLSAEKKATARCLASALPSGEAMSAGGAAGSVGSRTAGSKCGDSAGRAQR